MAKTTTTTNRGAVVRNTTGTISVIDYICPNCGRSMGKSTSFGRNNEDKRDSTRETEQVCSVCNKNVTIVCY